MPNKKILNTKQNPNKKQNTPKKKNRNLFWSSDIQNFERESEAQS